MSMDDVKGMYFAAGSRFIAYPALSFEIDVSLVCAYMNELCHTSIHTKRPRGIRVIV